MNKITALAKILVFGIYTVITALAFQTISAWYFGGMYIKLLSSYSVKFAFLDFVRLSECLFYFCL